MKKHNKVYTFKGTNHFMLVVAKTKGQAMSIAHKSASPIDRDSCTQIRGMKYRACKPKVLKIYFFKG